MATNRFEWGCRTRDLLVWSGALAALAVIAPSAQAQSTNCNWIGTTWSCNTPQPPAQSGINIDWGAAERAQQQQQAEQQQYWANFARQQAEQRAERDRRAAAARLNDQAEADRRVSEQLHANVGLMLQNRDCDGAQSTALKAGDIALAQQAKAFCAK